MDYWSMLAALLLYAVALGALYLLVDALPIREPFKRIALMCVIVLAILVILGILFGVVPLPRFR